MPSYSSAAARLPPEQEPGRRAAPLAKTIIFRGERMPPPTPPNGAAANTLVEKFAEFDKKTFAHKAAETAAAREIAAYVLRLEVERNLEPLRAELDALRSQVTASMSARQTIDTVSRTEVMRSGALIVGVTAAACWIGTVLSGTVLIHPLISVLLMIASVAFYGMSKLER
jgi:hypothetical protein